MPSTTPATPFGSMTSAPVALSITWAPVNFRLATAILVIFCCVPLRTACSKKKSPVMTWPLKLTAML